MIYSKTTDLVVRVIQLQARKWDKYGGSVFVSSTPSSSQVAATAAAATAATVAGPVPSKLNTDAPPFVPSGETEFHYQQPVRNAGESQFVVFNFSSTALSTVCGCSFFRGMEGLL